MEYREKLQQLSTEKLQCPYCNCVLANTDDTHKLNLMSLNYRLVSGYADYIIDCDNIFLNYDRPIHDYDESNCIIIEYIICPSCKKVSVIVHSPHHNCTIPISPKCIRKNFPDYIPKQIRKDYEEACLIAELSPKASATLSRRCVQGMIRDFWKIKKKRLCDEIDEVAKQPMVSEQQQKALHALRNIGNIGAHPERDIELMVDVEPDEAKIMVSLIEFFIENWYIQKHNEDEMMKEIISISEQKDRVKNHLDPN